MKEQKLNNPILDIKENNEVIIQNLESPPKLNLTEINQAVKFSIDSKQKSPGPNSMKGSILKYPNSPKKNGMSSLASKKVSVKDSPEIVYVEKYQNKGKTCTCVCRVF